MASRRNARLLEAGTLMEAAGRVASYVSVKEDVPTLKTDWVRPEGAVAEVTKTYWAWSARAATRLAV